jgi:hypothetical protein
MTCTHYKHALLELAARGAEPDQELRAHAQACSVCLSAFENERSLFASIDSGLHSSVNAEVPSSFIPTVRAQLQRESHPAQRSPRLTERLIWVSAFAAAAIILFTFTRFDQWVKPQSPDEQFATQRPESPVAQESTTAKPVQGSMPQIISEIGKITATKAAMTIDTSSVQTKNRQPEIIVQPDQEILLAHYADRWTRHHHSSATLLAESNPYQPDPLQVPLIQIAELDVKPLAPQEEDRQYDLRQK